MKIKLLAFAVFLFLLQSVFAQYADRYDDLYEIAEKAWPYVNDDNAHVRTFPSAVHSAIIAKYSAGIKVNIIEKTVNDENELWYEIRIDRNTTGWMHSDHVSFTETYPESKVYNREFDKYEKYMTQFYKELYRIHFADYPYPKAYEVINLIAGKEPVSHSEYSIKYNDFPGAGTVSTSIYQINDGFVEVDSYSSLQAITFTEDVPNTFGVKMGMTLAELKQIFGNEMQSQNSPAGIGECVNFVFNNSGRLTAIKLYYESGS